MVASGHQADFRSEQGYAACALGHIPFSGCPLETLAGFNSWRSQGPEKQSGCPKVLEPGFPRGLSRSKPSFYSPWAQGDESFQGFLWQAGHAMSPRSHRPQAEPYALPQAPGGTCPALGSKQHWPKLLTSPALGKCPGAATIAQGLSVDMFSKSRVIRGLLTQRG